MITDENDIEIVRAALRYIKAAGGEVEIYRHLKELVPLTVTYKCGDRFKYYDDEYILAVVGNLQCLLISVQDGNRFRDPPIKVKSIMEITRDEIKQMTGNKFDKFHLIQNEADNED